MPSNPYDTPKQLPTGEQAAGGQEKIVRSGAAAILAVLWNVPLLAVILLVCLQFISPNTMEWAIALWTLTIPAFSMALVFSTLLQRLVFVPGTDVTKVFPRLWGLAILWLALFGMWFAFEIFFSQ